MHGERKRKREWKEGDGVKEREREAELDYPREQPLTTRREPRAMSMTTVS